MKTKVFVFIVVTIGYLISIFAQNKIEISLNDAIKIAGENNLSIKSAAYSIKETEYAYRTTFAQGFPQVDAKIDYQNFFNSEANIGPMKFTFNPTSNFNISVGQLIFNSQFIIGLQLANIYRELSETNYKKTENDVKAQVINTYIMALVSQRSKEILQSNIKNLRSIAERTEKMVKVGMLDLTDYDQINLQISMLENNLKTLERQHEMALNLLRTLLNVDTSTEIILTDKLEDILAKSNIKETLNRNFDIKNSFDYQMMAFQRDVAKKKLLLERAKFLPTMTAFYSHTEKIKKPVLDFSPKDIVGFNISIPIFSSGVRYYNQAKAKIQLLTAENQLDIVTNQLYIQEKQLKFNLNNAYEQYLHQMKNIELARTQYKNISLKYEQGLVSSIDLTTANSNLLQAENSLLMSIMQLLEAKTNYDKISNQLINN